MIAFSKSTIRYLYLRHTKIVNLEKDIYQFDKLLHYFNVYGISFVSPVLSHFGKVDICMDLPVSKVDISLAVEAWKTLWIEASTNQVRADKVWLPTQQLLDEMAKNPPKKLTCFAGQYFMFPNDSNGIAVKLFFIGGKKHVAYLGTLMDPVANHVHRNREITRLSSINIKMAHKLANADLHAIMRSSTQLIIPADSDLLDTDTATRAVKKYLAIWSPKLCSCKIEWLKHKNGIEIAKAIRQQAEKTARYPTNQEDLLARAQDELELWE